MNASATATSVQDILRWRDLYRQEMNCQIIHDSLHAREGWTHSYQLLIDGAVAGYGAVAVAGPWKEKPTIFEFYVAPQHRSRVFDLFSALLVATDTTLVETQSNDTLLSTLLHALAPSVACESILFHDKLTTSHVVPAAVVRQARPDDKPQVGSRNLDTEAGWVLEFEGEVAGTGGILYHYNRPYGDIYMTIAEPSRGRGLGSYMVQELKRACYAQGSAPGARCNPANIASRKTLQKAGFVPCGNIVIGSVRGF